MEEKLIEFMRENRFLYDKSHRNYKNNSLRDEKFKALSVKLNIPAEKLKARWRTLRDKFYKDIKRKPSGSHADSPHKKWKWMDSLMFLNDVEMESISTQSNYCTATVEGDEDSFLSEFGESAFSTVMLEQTPRTSTHTTSGKKRKIEELIASTNKDFQRVTSLAEGLLLGGVEKSAIQLFFESLGKQAEEAKLTCLEMSELQLQMSHAFHQFLMNRRM